MSNIMDYLKWRGDIPFSLLPLNEVDNLILATLSYVKLDGIVPAPGEGDTGLCDAAGRYMELFPEEKGTSFLEMAPRLLKACARTERFRQVRLRNYLNRFDADANEQFCAVEVMLPGGLSYVSYRGTDDTIVGWKEDFCLCLGRVSAQEEAAAYLEAVLKNPDNEDRKVYVGGHSKGGNLAEYAAASVPEEDQDRIFRVFNNDGPGFTPDFIENASYQRIASRTSFFVPSFGIVGELLAHGTAHVIVQSSSRTIMAHDPFTWQVMGCAYETAPSLHKSAQLFNQTLADWIDGLEQEKRRAFIDDFFAVLEAPGLTGISDLAAGGLPVFSRMAQRLAKLEPDSRKIIGQLIASLLENMGEAAKGSLSDLLHKPEAPVTN